ncbi:MAG: hypothetical protein LUD07_11000 [Clostridiales bacterium]|nr:hypothetical protein [Clostridiales bacterium]
MKTKLIIDGNDVYEIDEECLRCKEKARQEKEQRNKKQGNETLIKNQAVNR